MIPRYVFGLFLMLITLAAVPFGANRMWAWGLLAVLVGVALLALATASAIQPANLHLPWARYRRLALAFLAVLAWMLVQASTLTPAFLHHPIWAEAAAALGRPLTGSIAVDRAAAYGEAAKFAAYGGVFWLALQFGGRDRRARIILWVLLCAIFVNAAYGLVIHFSDAGTILWFKRWAYASTVSGTFVNRNHFATYAGIGIVVAFAFLIEELRRLSAGISLRTVEGLVRVSEAIDFRLYVIMGILGVLGLSLILTGSRAALVVTAIGLATFLAVAALSPRVSGARVVRFGLVLAAGALVAVAFTGELVVERLEGASRNLGDRMQVFQTTAGAIADRPLLGTGGGSFESIFQIHRPESLGAGTLTYDHAHNTYLEFALEHGMPALIVVLFMMVLALATFARGAARRRRNDLLPAAGAGATMLVALHALVDFSLEIPAVAVAYLAVAGTAYAQSFSSRERNVDAPRAPGLSGSREGARARN
jgi:O-antigen ligase